MAQPRIIRLEGISGLYSLLKKSTKNSRVIAHDETAKKIKGQESFLVESKLIIEVKAGSETMEADNQRAVLHVVCGKVKVKPGEECPYCKAEQKLTTLKRDAFTKKQFETEVLRRADTESSPGDLLDFIKEHLYLYNRALALQLLYFHYRGEFNDNEIIGTFWDQLVLDQPFVKGKETFLGPVPEF